MSARRRLALWLDSSLIEKPTPPKHLVGYDTVITCTRASLANLAPCTVESTPVYKASRIVDGRRVGVWLAHGYENRCHAATLTTKYSDGTVAVSFDTWPFPREAEQNPMRLSAELLDDIKAAWA